MVDISIIVPVYNVQDYLPDCLDSLLAQTYKNIEIIVVNDGSTDHSQNVIDKYAKKDTRIIPLIKPNGGLSDARNFGMKHASGKYIGFVDGDDYVEPDMYEKMYKKAEKQNSDVVECNLFHNYPDKFDVEIGKRIYDKHEMIRVGRSVVWNKIYKKEWLDGCNVWFHVGAVHEDVEFYVKLVPFIRKISYIREAGIHYVFRKESIMNHCTRKILDLFDVFEQLISYYKEKGIYEEYKADLEYLTVRICLCNTVKRIAKIEESNERRWVFNENWRRLNELFPNWKKNPYLKKGKSKKEWYMKTMNKTLYYLYGMGLHILHQIQYKRLQQKEKLC